MAETPARQPFFNRLVGGILRSPLHPIVSGRVMLITVTGRRSGRHYTLPVEYRREGALVMVTSRGDRTWWRNLRGGAPVALRMRSHDLAGSAEVIEDRPVVEAELRAGGRRPEKAAALAADRVLVRVRLRSSRAGSQRPAATLRPHPLAGASHGIFLSGAFMVIFGSAGNITMKWKSQVRRRIMTSDNFMRLTGRFHFGM